MYAKKLFRKLQLKRIISSFLILAMCLTMVPMYSPMAYAKTDTSDAVSQIFVYAADSAKKDVLLKVIPIGDLDAIKHGDLEAKRNYYASFIDSFPTPNYVEGQGITIPELVEYVKNKTMVDKAASLNYTGSDKCYFYTTDGGIRNYTYDKMYGVTRSYYPGIYANWDAENGGIGNVDAVLGSAIAQPAYLALEQGGGRALIDLKEDVQANGNVVDGCMASKLATNESLRLVVPQTEADIKDGKQNFADSLKWINRIKLQPVASPIVSLGTVAAPTCIYELNGTTMTITLSCATEGASIYHSYDGTTMTTTAQNLYTEPIIINNYDSSKPFTLKYQAVKEGWDNVEVQSASSTNHTVADNSPNFNFALTNELTTVVNGGNYTINATLTSDKDFILYGAEFQVKVPNEFFTVGIPTANTGWQVAKATVDTNTVVTFTYLNQSGVAQTANTALALGNIPLTAIQAGNANLAIGNSIVTKSDATAYSKITAATLPITINEKSSNPLPIAVDSNITGGTVTTDSTALLGSIVNVQIQPATGQQLKADTLKYTADGGETYIAIEAKNGVYSFAMPASEVLI
ncbi:MAG: chitobiase/beta-hexosaminidase C-terminal domain-containing protein, partial [Clostridiales bacterium]